MITIFDTHTHLNADDFVGREDEELALAKEMGSLKQEQQVVVGFAAETNDLLENATKKLKNKNADMIVANNVSQGVFGSDRDKVTVLRKDKANENIAETTKVEIAKKIITLVAEELESRKVIK